MRTFACVLLLAGSADGATPPLASGPWGSREPVASDAAIVQSGKVILDGLFSVLAYLSLVCPGYLLDCGCTGSLHRAHGPTPAP